MLQPQQLKIQFIENTYGFIYLLFTFEFLRITFINLTLIPARQHFYIFSFFFLPLQLDAFS